MGLLKQIRVADFSANRDIIQENFTILQGLYLDQEGRTFMNIPIPQKVVAGRMDPEYVPGSGYQFKPSTAVGLLIPIPLSLTSYSMKIEFTYLYNQSFPIYPKFIVDVSPFTRTQNYSARVWRTEAPLSPDPDTLLRVESQSEDFYLPKGEDVTLMCLIQRVAGDVPDNIFLFQIKLIFE